MATTPHYRPDVRPSGDMRSTPVFSPTTKNDGDPRHLVSTCARWTRYVPASFVGWVDPKHWRCGVTTFFSGGFWPFPASSTSDSYTAADRGLKIYLGPRDRSSFGVGDFASAFLPIYSRGFLGFFLSIHGICFFARWFFDAFQLAGQQISCI